MTKIQQITHYLENEKLDAAVLSDPVTINYLTGFYSDPHERQMFLFVYPNHEPLLFVPALEVERASGAVPFSVLGYMDSENPWQKIKAALPAHSFKTVALEFDNLILTKYHGLKTVFDSAEFTNLTPYVNRLRLIKSADEIQKMLVAGQYADKAVNIGFDNISLDNTETDIIAQIDFAIKREGYEMSFETMVLTGNNAANPHGIPGANKVENNALLLFDLCCMVNGYASDMTRTVHVGQVTDEEREIYDIVLRSNQALIEAAKAGLSRIDFDRIPRQIINDAGYGPYFSHGIGHGIGLDIHEIPYFGKSEEPIEAGMVLTDEPGIYLDGKYGVRIEDDLLITETGCEVLTLAPKELIVI